MNLRTTLLILERDAQGEIHPNEKFPDMKALADYVHSKGLKISIYSSPGPKTCQQLPGSYQHEAAGRRTLRALDRPGSGLGGE